MDSAQLIGWVFAILFIGFFFPKFIVATRKDDYLRSDVR